MAVISRDLGPVTAYAAAVNRGYTGTRAEFEALMASYATVAQEAGESASAAADSASDAESSASAAATSASDASSFASAAGVSASNASNAATAAGIAQTAAESARDAAQSAQTAAEAAQEGAEAAVYGFTSTVERATTAINTDGTIQKELAKRQAEKSEAWAVGQINGEDVGVSDPAYHNNAKYWSEQIGTSAADAAADALASEGYATGKQSGTDVASDSPYYHANAKYHAEQAAASADAAAESARTLTIDGTLKQAGQAADAKATGDEISKTRGEIASITGNEIIDFTDGGYISLPTTVDVTTPTATDLYKYAVLPCQEGDIFTVSAKTNSIAVRPWGFVSAGGERLISGSPNTNVENIEITAPENAAYLVINSLLSGGDCYTGKLNTSKINVLSDELRKTNVIVDTLNEGHKAVDVFAEHPMNIGYSMNMTYGTIGSTSNASYYAANYNYLNITGYEKIFVFCNPLNTDKFFYAFFGTGQTLIDSPVTVTADGSFYELPIPEGAKYFNFCGKAIGTGSAQKSMEDIKVLGASPYLDGGEIDTKISTALSQLDATTGVNELRIRTNHNNISFAVKTGITNLFVGYGAGGDNDEAEEGDSSFNYDNGKYNTALGVGAFGANVKGDHCTAIGFTALHANTNGDFNTVLGEDALYANTTGGNNIAIGDHAGQNNNGNNNILIGPRVMRPATNASGNIIIGKEAGSVLDSGKNNIIIGNGLNPASDSNNNLMIGDSTHSSVVLAGKRIIFNQDGTVTWEAMS